MKFVNKGKKLFSVITCTYNSEKYLKECLNSVESQSFHNYEHIIVDGKSTDGTLSIIKRYQNRNRNTLFFSQNPEGVASAMNFAINKANGEYLIFLHSDDSLYRDDVLKNIANCIKVEKSPDLIYGKIRSIDKKNHNLGFAPKFPIFYYPINKVLKIVNYIPHQSTFVKKTVIEKYGGFNTSFKFLMDYDLWLRITPKIRWVFTSTVVANYRIHSKSLSSNPKNRHEIDQEYKIIMNKYLNGFERATTVLMRNILRLIK